MLLPLLLLALAALPAARAAPVDRLTPVDHLTHGGLALLHEIEDDVRELDGGYGNGYGLPITAPQRGLSSPANARKEIKPANHVAFSSEIPARYLAHNLGFFPDFLTGTHTNSAAKIRPRGDAWSSEKEE